MLCEDILLNVFHYFFGTTPRIWPILVWVCQRWRQIVFASPLGLNLRLYCTHRTPVLKSIDCWPALPIIVKYGGVPNLDPPAPEDDDNIIAALKQSGRVSSIRLTVTSSLLEKLSAISEPLSELEELVLLSQDNMQQTFPSTFGWGPRLRTLHSTGIAFTSLPPLLLPCQDLVDLQLHDIPSSGYFSPNAFTEALSGTPQLQSLTLHLLSFPRRSLLGPSPPPEERVTLLALTNLTYRGTSKYLDNLVAQIDAAHLGDIDITLFNQPTMDVSQIGRFIERLEMQTLFSNAEVKTSAHAISISFTDLSVSTPLRLQISCKQLDWQLSCMAQVCDQFSPFLSRVTNVGINTTEPPSENNDVADEQWLVLLRSFGGACDISVAGKLVTEILRGLCLNGNTSMLPSLRHLRVLEPMEMRGPSWDSVQSFNTARWISNRHVEVEVLSYQCHICRVSFQGQHGHRLKDHLSDMHGYQIVCSYCDNFGLGSRHHLPNARLFLFLKHLKRKHLEIMLNDHAVLRLAYDRKDKDLGHRDYISVHKHTSTRPPDVVPPTFKDRLHGTQADTSESDSEGWFSHYDEF